MVWNKRSLILFAMKEISLVAELLGLKLKKEISVNAAIGFQAPDEAVHSANKFVEERFKTIKIKTGRKNFDEDYNTIKAIRESVGDEIKIRIDSNGKWSVNQAAEYLNRLQEFSIEYAEQPVNSADEFKELKQKTSVPLAADESIRDIDSAKKFISEKNIDYVILKPMMIGGLISTLDIIELAEKNNVIPVVTTSFESAIGRSNAVIAAASVKADIAHGLAVSKYFEDDIAVDKYPITNGTIRIY
jgi:o-succinylbenzoate synthase